MIIVSQDKKDVAVFDNMKILGVRGHKIAITDNITTSGSAFVIGEYKTEERAKEVLDAIVATYQANKIFETAEENCQNQMADKYLEAGIEPFKYEMPKE